MDAKKQTGTQNPAPVKQMKVQQKRIEKKVPLASLLSENGNGLLHLFAYQLNQKFKDKSITQLGKQIHQIMVNQVGLTNILKRRWPDIQEHYNIIPQVFTLLKDLGAASLRRVQQLMEMGAKTMNPFMAQLKKVVPSSRINRAIDVIKRVAEREDLHGIGQVDKLLVEDICKKQLQISEIKWDPRLIVGDDISYNLLISEKYFGCGQSFRNYTLSLLIKKLVKVIKAVGVKKSKKKKKTARDPNPRTKLSQKQVIKKQTIIKNYIEDNKPAINQNRNQIKFISKSIVEDLIFSVVEFNLLNREQNKDASQKVDRHVFVCEPQLPEIQYQGMEAPTSGKILGVRGSNLGLMVGKHDGCIIDVISGSKVSNFVVHPCHALVKSPIIDYELFGQHLYLLREDGLLYCWHKASNTFQYQIKTAFSVKNIEAGQRTKYLSIRDGIIFLNCTHLPHSRFYLFSTKLKLLGRVQLNPLAFNISYSIVREAMILKATVLPVLEIDKLITSYSQYEALIKTTIQGENFTTHNPLQLGQMLTSHYRQFTASKLQKYVKWILSYRRQNTVIWPSKVVSDVQFDQLSASSLEYLQTYFYLNSETELNSIKQCTLYQSTNNRKANILTLMEDYHLSQLNSSFLTKQQLLQWIEPCCLLPSEIAALLSACRYDVEGNIDVSDVVTNQHYCRIIDARNQSFNTEQYKVLQMPSVYVGSFIPMPIHKHIVLTTHFPISPIIYVVDMDSNVMNRINVAQYGYNIPRLHFCPSNDYIFAVSGGSVLLFDPTQITKCEKPKRALPNLQQQAITDLVIVYEVGSILTLSKGCVKVWQLNSLILESENKIVFKIKPGYMGVEPSKKQIQPKKKLYFRGDVQSVFYCPINNQLIAGVMSEKKGSTYIWMFHISKLTITVSKAHQHHPIPHKLIQQLHTFANKRRHQHKLKQPNFHTTQQSSFVHSLTKHYEQRYKARINKEQNVNEEKNRQLHQRKLNQAISDYYNIHDRMMGKKKREERVQCLLEIWTGETVDEKVVEMYGGVKREAMLEGVDVNERKLFIRILYTLSVIEKYSRPIDTQPLITILSSDRQSLNIASLMQLCTGGNNLSILEKSLQVLNKMHSPVQLAMKIIRQFLPTRFRFHSPHYYKQILSPNPSPQLYEYILTHYDQQPAHQQIVNQIMHNHKYNNIHDYLNESNLLPVVNEQVYRVMPDVVNSNYTLIQALQCYKLISQDEAIYYTICQSNHPTPKLSSLSTNTTRYNADQVMSSIMGNMMNISKRKLPKPTISFDYFESTLYKGQYSVQVFYNLFKGCRNTHTVVTEQLLSYCDVFEKGLSLTYDRVKWLKLVGDGGKVLKPLEKALRERFPLTYRIVTLMDFKVALMNYIDEEKIYEQVTEKCGMACSNGQSAPTHINLNYLFRYTQQYTPLDTHSQPHSSKPPQQQIQIPGYFIIKLLQSSHRYLTPTTLYQLLQHNITGISLNQCQELKSQYFHHNANFCAVTEMGSILDIHLSTLGQMLLSKYHRMDFQYKLTLVEYEVSVAQIVELLGGNMVYDLVFGEKRKEFVDYHNTITKIRNHMLIPAVQLVALKIVYGLNAQMIQYLQWKAETHPRIPVSTISKYLEDDSTHYGLIQCVVRHLGKQTDNAQTIDITTFLHSLSSVLKYDFTAYKKAISSWEHLNPIQLFLSQAEPNHLTQPTIPINQYVLVPEHMTFLTKDASCPWVISYNPYASLPEFLHHISGEHVSQQCLKAFIQGGICKYGIDGVIEILGKQEVQFSDFYTSLRNGIKALRGYSLKQMCQLFKYLLRYGSKIDKQTLYKGIQSHIPIGNKVEWVCAAHDKNKLEEEQNGQNLDDIVALEHSIVLMENLYQSPSQKGQIIDPLHYNRYLIAKYFQNDPLKIQKLSQILQPKDPILEPKKKDKKDSKKKQTKSTYAEFKESVNIYGVTDEYHIRELYHYIGKNINTIKQEYSNVEVYDVDIDEVEKCMQKVQEMVNKGQNINVMVQKQLESTKLYKGFVNGKDGVGWYYPTYHALLLHCRGLLISHYKQSKERNKILQLLNNFLIRSNISIQQLYEVLNLSTQQSMMQAFPYCLKPHNLHPLAIETFIKYDELGLEIKYPISSKKFKQIMKLEEQVPQESEHKVEELFRKMDVGGTGYVNLNDVEEFRATVEQPYVNILQFLHQKFPTHNKPVHPTPPKQHIPIIKQLLQWERVEKRNRIIGTKQCLNILSQYMDEDSLYFISHTFQLNNQPGYLNLSSLIYWLKNASNTEQKDEKVPTPLQEMVRDVEEVGGIVKYVKLKSKEEADSIQKKIELHLPKQSMSSLAIALVLTPQAEKFRLIVEHMVNLYYQEALKWNTHHNQFVRIIKNIAQSHYNLLQKFYFSHTRQNIHQIYEDISRGDKLNFLTLWRHIEWEGIIGYGREDIEQVFQLIDVNASGEVSYREFMQFWMACEQVFPKTQPHTPSTPINKLKAEMISLVVKLCEGKAISRNQPRIYSDELKKLLNIQNEEKISKLIQIMNEQYINPIYGFSRSKVKILFKKQANQHLHPEKQSQKHVNLLLSITKGQLEEYLCQVDKDKCKKIILTKYPVNGCRIVQYLHDLTHLKRQSLNKLYNQLSSINYPLVQERQRRIVQKSEQMTQRIFSMYKKYNYGQVKIEYYGNSIGYALMNQYVLGECEKINEGIRHLSTFINKNITPSVPITYSLQKSIICELQPSLHDPLRVIENQKPLSVSSHQHALYQITYSSYPKYNKTEIRWLQPQHYNKSESKVSLLQHLSIYQDSTVSALNIIKQESSRYSIAAYSKPNYKPITQLTVKQALPPTAIFHFLSVVVNKLYYVYQRYRVCGLLLFPHNLWVHEDDHYNIVFGNLLSGFSVGADNNYIDGINCYDLINLTDDIAPQIYNHIYTPAIDVYSIGVLIYMLMGYRKVKCGRKFKGEEESLWSYYSQVQQKSKEKVGKLSELKELEGILWSLVYECTQFQWFDRPKIYQVLQTIHLALNFSTKIQPYLFIIPDQQTLTLDLLKQGNTQQVVKNIKSLQSPWTLPNITSFLDQLTASSPPQLFEAFNTLLINYLQVLPPQTQTLQQYLTTAVNYLLLPHAQQKALCMVTVAAYKTILRHARVQEYLFWCDESWRVEEFDIMRKLEQINMADRINTLHKNSSYYHDLTVLAECRTALQEAQVGKRAGTGKKVSISFIHSALISNNVNKVYAVYRSGVIGQLSPHLSVEQLRPIIINILKLVTKTLNPTQHINPYRRVDQVYKVMMVIYNMLEESSSPKKTSPKKESVVGMLEYLNDYYNVGGEECSTSVMSLICKQQVCTLPFLMMLFCPADKGDDGQILINLSYHQQYYFLLKSPSINAYPRRMKGKHGAQIQEAIHSHQLNMTLGQLSTMPINRHNYLSVVEKHLKFYYYYRYQRKGKAMRIMEEVNYYTHFQNFLHNCANICMEELAQIESDEHSLRLVSSVVKAYRVMLETWAQAPFTPDQITESVKFLLHVLHHLYCSDPTLYTKSPKYQHILPDLLSTFTAVTGIPNILTVLKNSNYVYYYVNIIKKQYELLHLYIEKNVEKIHLMLSYELEAEYRLCTIEYFVKQDDAEVDKLLIGCGLVQYLVETMLADQQVMDLRYYKAHADIVPYRFCNPLRAEAIAICGLMLTQKGLLSNHLVGAILPIMQKQYQILAALNFSSAQEKMTFVEVLWFFANLLQCDDERIKYQFVNIGVFDTINKILSKYSSLSIFFPKMSETIKTGSLFNSSLALSRSMLRFS